MRFSPLPQCCDGARGSRRRRLLRSAALPLQLPDLLAQHGQLVHAGVQEAALGEGVEHRRDEVGVVVPARELAAERRQETALAARPRGVLRSSTMLPESSRKPRSMSTD